VSSSPSPDPSSKRAVDEGAIDAVFRAEFGRVVATLARVFGDLTIAEDAAQDAFVVALRTWPTQGMPPNPGGWLTTTARRRAIDRLRSDAARDDRHARAALLRAEAHHEELDPMEDDRLRLIFTCCHPALAPPAQVALTLRLLGGLQTPEIARALLLGESALVQRIVRAKRKIRAANVPYRVPEGHELPDRLAGVLAVVYLVFNEGHTPTAGEALDRPDLSAEAIRLAHLLADLMPDEPEVLGLLALLLLTQSRRAARTRPDGSLAPLSEQDRRLWDRALIAEGQSLVRRCLRRARPGPYQLQAAIAAVHSDAARTGDTDWRQILTLYDQLLEVAPTPVVALNRAVAMAEVAGPAAALASIDALDLDQYQPWHAARADLLRRLGAVAEAAEAYDRAAALTGNATEKRFLLDRRAALVERSPT
jgi:RNA polymerase sigma-70 factor, ECF subfamily